MHSLTLCLILALGAAPAEGGDLARAQREIEEQLRQAVRIPEPQLDVEFEGLDASRYALKEAAFSLDGVELPVEPGARRVFQGEVKPGRHAVDVRLVYEERKGLGIFTYADAKLTVDGSLGVKSERGLATRLRVRVLADPKADPQHRLKLASDLSAEMLAKVDDSVGDLLATQRHVETAAAMELAATPAPPPAAGDGEMTRDEAPLAAGSATPHTHRHVVREVLARKSRKGGDAPRPAQTANLGPTASPVATAAALETTPVATPSPTPPPAPSSNQTAAAGAPPVVPGEGAGRLVALAAVAAGALLLAGLFVFKLRRA